MLRALSFAAIVATATPASADVFTLFGELHGGGSYGTGTGGDQPIKDSAFFAEAPHLDYGFLVGAELMIFDARIQHHQFTDGDRIATWTQFGAGVHLQSDLSDEKGKKSRNSGFFEAGIAGFFGIGTGQQVMPPLDNAQVTDKGLLLEGRVAIGKHLSNVFDFGLTVPVSWGFFFKNGDGAAINDVSTHYQSLQGEALLFLRANIRLL